MSKETRTVHVKVTSNVGSVTKQNTKASASTKKLATGLKGVASSAAAATGGIKSMAMALISSGVGAVAIALGTLAAGIGAALNKSIKFEQSLSTLKAITSSSSAEMKVMSDQAKALGSSTAFTASQVVELQTELGKLGFSTTEIEASTSSILSLAASLDVGLGEAAALSGSLVKSFGLDVKDTARVVDVMAKSTSSSALDFETLRESLKLVAPVSSATGVSIEKTTALLGVLADRGLKGSIAGTGLAKTFIELNKKGLTLEEGMAKINGAADPLKEAIDLVGVIAGKTFLTLSKGSEDIGGLEQSFINAKGAADKMAETKLDNLAGDTTKLSSAWEGLLLSIEDGEGVISGIARGFIQATTAVLSFLTPTKSVVKALEDERNELFKLEGQLYNTNTSQEKRLEIIRELKKQHPTQLANIKAETATNEELSEALALVNEQLIKKGVIASMQEDVDESVADTVKKRMKLMERERVLAQSIAENRRKFGLEATEGSLEEQAQAQIKLINDKKSIDNANESNRANTSLGKQLRILTGIQKEYNEANNETQGLLDNINKTTEEFGLNAVEDDSGGTVTSVTTVDTPTELTEEQKAALKDQVDKKNKFLAKLEIDSQNVLDDTEQKKIERARERHLEELKTLKMNKTELKLAEKEINDLYDAKQKEREDKKTQEQTDKDDREKERQVEKANALVEKMEQDKMTDLEKLEYQKEQDLLVLSALKDSTDAKLAVEAKYKKDVTEIEEKAAKHKTEMQLGAAGSLLGSMGSMMKKGSKAQQDFAIASATVDMFTGMSKVWGLFGTPEVTSDMLMKTAASANILTTGIANIKNIKKAGKGGGGGSVPSVSNMPPAVNVVGRTSAGERMIGSAIGDLGNKPSRAYIVESDMASNTALQRRVNDTSSMG